ncbi:MAG: GatB/YqeY domain-containing protein [Acidobacteriota bacterium]
MSTSSEATPIETLQADIKTAMKAKDKDRLSTLRMLLSALKNAQIDGGEALDQTQFERLVQKSIKQRQDAASQYRDGGREELAAKEEAEITILEHYLPEQVSDDAIRAAIEAFVAEKGLSGPKAMGPVMGAMRARFGTSAEGATISRIAKAVLAS